MRDGEQPLKVTSPRLDRETATLTAVGRREVLGLGVGSGETEQQTKSNRAVAEESVGLEDSEQVTLDGGDA